MGLSTTSAVEEMFAFKEPEEDFQNPTPPAPLSVEDQTLISRCHHDLMRLYFCMFHILELQIYGSSH